jgi:fucose permease
MLNEQTRRSKRRATAVFFFLAGIIAASWSSRIPDVQQQLGLKDAAWGSILMALPAGLITGLLVSSWLVTRFGTHRIMIGGCLCASLTLCCIGLSNTSAQLVVALFFTGFIRTIFNISMNTEAVDLQKNYPYPIITTFHGLWSLACLVAAGIGQLMITAGHPPSLHFFIITLACITINFFYRKNIGDEHVVPEKRPFLVKPDRYLWLLGAIAFCGMIGENTILDWSINYFERVVRAGKGTATMGFISFIITMAAGRLLGDRLIHAYGHLRMLTVNGILMGTGFLIASFFPYLFPAAFGFFLVGAGDSLIVPIVYALAGRSGKMPSSYAIAAVTLIGYSGFLLAPLLNGFLSQAFGMQWAMTTVGCIALFIPLLVLLVRKNMEAGQASS